MIINLSVLLSRLFVIFYSKFPNRTLPKITNLSVQPPKHAVLFKKSRYFACPKFLNQMWQSIKSPFSSVLCHTWFGYFLPLKLASVLTLPKIITLPVQTKTDNKIHKTNKKNINRFWIAWKLRACALIFYASRMTDFFFSFSTLFKMMRFLLDTNALNVHTSFATEFSTLCKSTPHSAHRSLELQKELLATKYSRYQKRGL